MRVRVAPELDSLRATLRTAAQTRTEQALQAGFDFDGRRYQCTPSALAFYLSALAAGLSLPDDFAWRDADNQLVPMTDTQFKQFAMASMAYHQQTLRAGWALKDQIDASRRPEEIGLEIP